MKFQLVQMTDDGLVSNVFDEANALAAFEVRGFPFAGIKPGHAQLRAELQNQPSFKGVYGPMWGGEGVLRYETPAAYDRLST